MIESLSESTRTQDVAVYAAWLQAQQGLAGPRPAERSEAGPAPIQDRVEFSAAARVEAGVTEKAPAPKPAPGPAKPGSTEDQVDLSPEAKKQAEEAESTQKSSDEQESKAGLSIAELKRLAAQGDYQAKMLLALYEAAGISVS